MRFSPAQTEALRAAAVGDLRHTPGIMGIPTRTRIHYPNQSPRKVRAATLDVLHAFIRPPRRYMGNFSILPYELTDEGAKALAEIEAS